jgi:hypothetical protein
MLEEKLKIIDCRDNLYDKFGNRVDKYVVEKYYKNGNNTWVLEETIKTEAGSYFVVDEKFYFGCNGFLIPLNMDFNSENCNACYKIAGKDVTDYKMIIGNECLCKNEYLELSLHRQEYSDGTCFYTLVDNRGEFRVDYANSDLLEIIKVLKSGVEANMQYMGLPSMKKRLRIQEN